VILEWSTLVLVRDLVRKLEIDHDLVGISWTLQFLNGLQKTAFNEGEERKLDHD
jgi:hypothetical protein